MNDFVILGTDTDAGKTTFALYWLSLYPHESEYWKPIECGTSDSETIARLVPAAAVHAVAQRFDLPVAPPLAARQEGSVVLAARALAAARPKPTMPGRGLLIETFGGPFSPLNEHELQTALLRALALPCVLVSSTALGTIGRTLQCLVALETEGIVPHALVLLGPTDTYARDTIRRHHPYLPMALLTPPPAWEPEAIRASAESQRLGLGLIHTALTAPAPRRTPDFDELLRKDERAVWHPYTPLRGADEPLFCVGAEDEFLELADGRRVIDGISSWWTILHGHRFPPLMQALREAAARLDHVLFAGVTHPDAVAVAELLVATLSWDGGRVFYSDNGSTAVEVALKLAYQFWCHHQEPGRTRFVGFEHAYHGDTFGAMAVSRDPLFFGRFEPLLLQADIVPLDPERLDEHLTKQRGKVAGVILEPLVQGAGGMRMHSPETLRQLVEITHRHDVLFIADEVMTGCGRTGTFWAHQAAGVVPDLIATAKTLAGGILPLAATLAGPRVVAAFETDDRRRTFFHGHSFTANPLACAVARKNLELLGRTPPSAPARHAAFWRQTLQPLSEHRHVRDVRICGSIAAIELKVEGGYLARAGQRLRQVALEHQVLLRPLGSVLYALPPFCTSAESLERIAQALKAAVDVSSVAGSVSNGNG